MKRSTGRCHKQVPPQTDTSPAFCSITSALKAPCCTILESTSDGVFTVDVNKRVTSFNQAAELITGFKSSEAVGQYCFDVFRANICETKCALDETLATGRTRVNLPALIISKSGVQKPISISTGILKNENNDIIGGVETFRDLSYFNGELERIKGRKQRYSVPLVFSIDVEIGVEGKDMAVGIQLCHPDQAGICQRHGDIRIFVQ